MSKSPPGGSLVEGASGAKGRSRKAGGAKADILALRAAFQAFQRATEGLRTSYLELQERMRSLNVELEEKNRVLHNNLEEKELMRRHLHEILESLTTGVVVFNERGELTILNGAARTISGYSGEEMCSAEKTIALFLPQSDGTAFSQEGISAGRGMETTFRRKDGRLINLRLTVTPLVDLEGRDAGLILLFDDITWEKRIAEKAERASRLTAMGEMAANIAHEIRNPLGSIELFAGCLGRSAASDGSTRRVAEHIGQSVKSLNNVLSNVLHFANPPRPRFTRLDIHGVVRDALSLAAPFLRQQGVQAREEFFASDGHVMADAELMWQVFYNLILNAAQAMPRGGKLTVETFECSFDSAEHPEREGRVAGLPYDRSPGATKFQQAGPEEVRWLMIRFIDTGVGLNPDTLGRIFDPFFTTKSRGTGLGLSIANAIVESHRGMMEADSSLGEGSVFTISLPLDGSSPAGTGVAEGRLSARGRKSKAQAEARPAGRKRVKAVEPVRGGSQTVVGKEGGD